MFAAVKGGVLAFSKSLARSVAPRVRVNVLAPGWIETSFGAGLDDGTRDRVADSTPLKRWGTPDDVAGAVVFLASPAAAFITGQTLVVGGECDVEHCKCWSKSLRGAVAATVAKGLAVTAARCSEPSSTWQYDMSTWRP